VHREPRIGAEVVPLLLARPGRRQALGRLALAVLDVHLRDLELLVDAGDPGVVAEVGADEAAVPRPRVLGVGGGVDAEVAVAGPDVALEGGLLRVVEDVAGGAEPDHGVVLGEVRVRERVGVLGGVDLEALPAAELADRGGAVGDAVGVPERGRLGEDEYAELRVPGRDRLPVSGRAAVGAGRSQRDHRGDHRRSDERPA
jgi:hypothetical protein